MPAKNEEGKFLHDLSSPLTTIQLNIDNAISILKENGPNKVVEALQLLERSLEQSVRVGKMVQERKEILVKTNLP